MTQNLDSALAYTERWLDIIKRNRELNSRRTVAGAARCNPEVDGSSPPPATKST